MKEKLANLAKLSRYIGSRFDYVQGGGGNISVKIFDYLMAIKASGYELKNVTEEAGFAFVNHQEINKEIAEFCHNESFENQSDNDEKFSSTVKLSSKEIAPYPKLRPSMETGFHCLLPFSYVVHSHAVYATVLACASEGKKIIAEIFPESLWIDYHNPGWQLTAAISQALKNTANLPQIIFLQNHGLIVAGNNADQVLELHEEVNQKIISHLKIKKFDPAKIIICDREVMNKNVFFPDQIVFGLSEEFAESQVAKHIFAAYSYIAQSIEKSNLTPVFVTQKNVDFVANMESEKYRKEVAKK
jgi:rhamnose utilization protein RhaD (predicted bifunctional aldolase and dehydrogenase)